MSETKKFVELVAANQGLPIVAMVNGEICEPDATLYWMGSFSAASVELIGLIDERWYDDVDDFKEVYYDKYSEELCEKFNYDPRCCAINVDRGLYTQEQFAANCLAEEELEKYLSEMVKKYMRRCIVVYVDEPDMSQWEEA
jgi:hypothetical protein